MMKIDIVTLGHLKEKYFISAAQEYSKRLSKYCKLTVSEIPPVKLSDNPSDTEIKSALEKEAVLIRKKTDERSRKIALCIEGEKLSSEKFSKLITSVKDSGEGSITFIIGSSYGLSPEIKKEADLKLSLSDMTFPHKLFRVMLLEQIYRAFKINEGSKYHK